MAFQLLILLTFQTMYGYLFYKLGIILTAFMAGLALGAIFAAVIASEPRTTRVRDKLRERSNPVFWDCFVLQPPRNDEAACGPAMTKKAARYYRMLLIAIQGDFVLFSILLGVIFSRFCPDSLFPVLSVIAGSIGGAQFAIANKILLGQKRDVGRVGGLSYGVDLFGSFFGALLTGIFLIPILGIPKTCFAVALINVAVLVLLFVNMRVEE